MPYMRNLDHPRRKPTWSRFYMPLPAALKSPIDDGRRRSDGRR